MFDRECNIALTCGLSYEQYWDGYVDIFYYYAKRYYEKSKSDMAELDLASWMTGAYVKDAFAEIMSAVVGSKGRRPKYPNSPVFYLEFDKQAKEEKEKASREQELKNLELMFKQAVKKQNRNIVEATPDK